MKLIGIAGKTASGKTSVARCLEQMFGAVRIRYSEILADMARERDLPTDKATLQNLYVKERETRGEGFLAEMLGRKIDKVEADLLVIEGNRRMVDIELLKQIAIERDAELTLLYVDAALEERFARYNERQKNNGEEVISREAFMALEANPAEDELPKIRALIEKEGVILQNDSCSEEEMLDRALKVLALPSQPTTQDAPSRS